MALSNMIPLVLAVLATARGAQLPAITDESPTTVATSTPEPSTTWPAQIAPLDTVAVSCQPDSMLLTITLAKPDSQESDNFIYDDPTSRFNGIVYPAGLGKNSTCLREYRDARGDLHYSLPLNACNTMAVDNEDGTVEYFNSIVVQPHLRLVTGQGRGYHVRCRYRRKDLTQYHHYHRQADGIRADRLSGNALDDDGFSSDEDADSLPSVTMKIYRGDPEQKQVASNVKIGETLTLVVSVEKQPRLGLLVSSCVVRDGLGWAEQSLIADDGCPLDGEIMGMFQYSSDKREARVAFPAHRFPYTASVYYTCEAKLCDLAHPTDCEPCTGKKEVKRARRQADEGSPAAVEVSSGLYVNEQDDDVTSVKNEDEICISQRNFAIGICVAGVILMLGVVAAVACLLSRRRPKAASRSASSLYSGPYTNTGYSHTS